MKDLPLKIPEFAVWWLIEAPRRIFITFKRAVILTNYEFPVTLDIRLFFTPLFGDYTWIGRLMGFIFRVFRIITGVIAISFVSLFFLSLLLGWYLLPFYLIYETHFWFAPFLVFSFVVWLFAGKNLPSHRVNQVSDSTYFKSFRPRTSYYSELFGKVGKDGLPRFFEDPSIAEILKRLELQNTDFVARAINEYSGFDPRMISRAAFDLAKEQGVRYVEPEHLFFAVISLLPNYEMLLASYEIDLDNCKRLCLWLVERREELSKIFFWQEDFEITGIGGTNRGWTGRVTPKLDTVSEDLTEEARKGFIHKVIGREDEIDEIAGILSSASRENVLIIGEPGSGKSAIVKGLALQIIKGTRYESLKFRRIVRLDAGSLIAGTRSPGDLAKKLTEVMEEVEGSGGIILFIDEFHNLVGTTIGGAGSEISSIFSVLQPYLSSGKIQFVGATNIQNYRKFIEPSGEFSRLFQIVEIKEATPEDTLRILEAVAKNFEKQYGITISYPALMLTVKLSKKLIHERVFPDKAIDVLGRAAVVASKEDRLLTTNDVETTVSELTHVPVTEVTEDESRKLMGIEDEMKERVIGQDPAIAQLSRALKRARVGIRNEEKPIASFLFVGTTGVGKTETAKTLAKVYFGDEKAMIRLDMSEYQQQDSINRLLGSPDGDIPGQLTDAVRSKPFALILLDEIEKAYPSILLTFLQVLDDGRLTDSSGRTVDFTNTIIIATSNVGTRDIQEIAERQGMFDEMKDAAMAAVRKQFAPEFLNRFNGIVVFRPLNQGIVRQIAEIMLESVKKNAEDKKLEVSFKQELVTELANKGYSPQWGARPLRRVIEESVETFLAEKLLSGDIKPGDSIELGPEVLENISVDEPV